MEALFGAPVCHINGFEKLHVVSPQILSQCVKMWEFNRPIDEKKVLEIMEHIKTHDHVDGIIYIARPINSGLTFVCFDGNHRREAIVRLYLEGNLLPNMTIFLQVMDMATPKSIEERYLTLNKATPVAELYMIKNRNLEQNVQSQKSIEHVVSYLVGRFPKHQLMSLKPRRPNFNRFLLTNKITRFAEKRKEFVFDEKLIIDQIEIINNRYSTGDGIVLANYPKTVLEKCKMTGCYLFLKKFLPLVQLTECK
ncbi:MAG: hypothetical protein KAS12_01805 [Candidatus Aenigmarchaeota archaeon]|nr:hypothetical protein [Candidatus Aenigmarchaeota archaeon]